MTANLTTTCYLCYPAQDLVGATIVTVAMDDSDDDFSSLTDGLTNFQAMSGDAAELLERTRVSIETARASSAAFRSSARGSNASTAAAATNGTGSKDDDDGPAKKNKKAMPKDLPPELMAFKYEFRHRMVITEELNPLNKENPGPCRVATTVTVGKEGQSNYQAFELAKLTSSQLRKLAISFGCKGGGGKTKFDCRRALASRVDMGTAYDSACNPASTANKKRINALMRLVNCCFLPCFRQRFLELNDRISRSKFETEGGSASNLIKEFWTEVSSAVNDTEAEEELATVLFSGEDEDACMHKMVTEGDIDLNVFNLGTWSTCRQNVSDMIKARSDIVVAMKESGHHCNDPVQCLRRTHLTVRKGVVMEADPVCYLLKHAKEHPAINQACTQVLCHALRSESHGPIDIDDSKKKGGADAKLIEALEKSTLAMQSGQQAEVERTNMAKGELASCEWDEHLKLSDTIDKLQSGPNVQLHFNFTKRVREVEGIIGVDSRDSIVGDIVEHAPTQNNDDNAVHVDIPMTGLTDDEHGQSS